MEGVLCFPTRPTGKILQPPEPNRMKIPKDGLGPRGAPDCYYTSRVLNSTFRYARFVKRLRALEEEIRIGEENKNKALKDVQRSDFFLRCDRKQLLHRVEHRVALCLESYERDLEDKRERLRAMLTEEEKQNTRKLVEQAQHGSQLVWEEKLARLDYLLKKRAKEHADKYKDPPLFKCPHVWDHIRKQQDKEQACCHLLQMKEKQARRDAEREMDMMWHEVAMREADALAARMEIDAIAQKRRDMECKIHSDRQLEINKQKREEERERLKQETLWLKSIWEADIKKEEEAQRLRQEKTLKIAKERDESRALAQCLAKKKQEEEAKIQATWDEMTAGSIADLAAEAALVRKRREEHDACNRVMIQMKEALEQKMRDNEPLVEEDRKRIQHQKQVRMCEESQWRRDLKRDTECYIRQQIRDKVEKKKQDKIDEAKFEEYLKETDNFGKDFELRPAREAAARKRNAEDLLEQIKYNHLLKEREIKEEQEQLRRYAEANRVYMHEIDKMMQRPFFTEGVHPFMRQMTKDLKMRNKCPCSKPDYCSACYNESAKYAQEQEKECGKQKHTGNERNEPANAQGVDPKNAQGVDPKNAQETDQNEQKYPTNCKFPYA